MLWKILGYVCGLFSFMSLILMSGFVDAYKIPGAVACLILFILSVNATEKIFKELGDVEND